MNTFTIGGTDFGISPNDSSLELDHTEPERPVFVLEIRGDEQIFATLTENEDSEWSWALYPPHLYIRGLEVKDAKAVLKGDEELEAALYMMEHNAIFDVKVTLTSTHGIELSGLVDLMGEGETISCQVRARWGLTRRIWTPPATRVKRNSDQGE